MSAREWVQNKKNLFPKVSREKRGTVSQRPRGTAWMKKVRNIGWHIVLIDILKTETSNFVLHPNLHWKPVECSEQCCCTCMSLLTEDKSGCMVLYALKSIQFVVRDTNEKRITVVSPRENEGNSKFVGSIS